MSLKKNVFPAMEENRNYGIELLRVVAMFMVVVLHVLGNGGVLYAQNIAPVNYSTACFLEIAVFCAFDVYALISGFVGYRSKKGYASLATLWLQVLLYSVSFTLINKLFFNHTIGWRKLLFSFFVITKGDLWYFTAYFALMFLRPVLNAAAEAMPRRVFRNAVGALAVLFTVVPFLWARDTFDLIGGYSLIWLVFLYLAGAYIGKYRAFEKMKKRTALFGFLACVLLVWCSKMFIENVFPVFMNRRNNGDWLVNFTAFPVFMSAVFLLCFFRGLRLPAFAKKAVAVFAPLSFGVYVIHQLPLIRENVITNQYVSYASLSPLLMAAAVIGTAAVIFLACSALDFVRACLFRLLRVEERMSGIELRLSEKIRRIR